MKTYQVEAKVEFIDDKDRCVKSVPARVTITEIAGERIISFSDDVVFCHLGEPMTIAKINVSYEDKIGNLVARPLHLSSDCSLTIGKDVDETSIRVPIGQRS